MCKSVLIPFAGAGFTVPTNWSILQVPFSAGTCHTLCRNRAGRLNNVGCMSLLGGELAFLLILLLAVVATVHGDAVAVAAAGGDETGAARVSGAVAVATAAELAAAVTDGAAHVVITKHLDLTSLPVYNGADGALTNATADFRTLFVGPIQLQSLRVCSAMHATAYCPVRAHAPRARRCTAAEFSAVQHGDARHGGHGGEHAQTPSCTQTCTDRPICQLSRKRS